MPEGGILGLCKTSSITDEPDILPMASDDCMAEVNAVARPSPIERLPVELLGHVFKMAVTIDTDVGHYPHSRGLGNVSFQKDKAPLLLTQISRHWHWVATGIPSFWSDITLRWTTTEFPKGVIPLLRMWLARSQQLPLNIDLRITHFYGNSVAVFAVLREEIHRWKRVDFGLPSEAYYQSPLFCDRGSAPLLESATFRLEWESVPPMHVGHPIRSGYDTPSLQMMTIHKSFFGIVNDDTFHWKGLSKLSLDSVPGCRLLSILLLCSATLEELELADPGSVEDDLPELVLPRLHQLKVPYCGDTSLLRSICAPELKTVAFGEVVEEIFTMEFLQFLISNSPKITELCLSAVWESLWPIGHASVFDVIRLQTTRSSLVHVMAFITKIYSSDQEDPEQDSPRGVFPHLTLLAVTIRPRELWDKSQDLHQLLAYLGHLANRIEDEKISLSACPKLQKLHLRVGDYDPHDDRISSYLDAFLHNSRSCLSLEFI